MMQHRKRSTQRPGLTLKQAQKILDAAQSKRDRENAERRLRSRVKRDGGFLCQDCGVDISHLDPRALFCDKHSRMRRLFADAYRTTERRRNLRRHLRHLIESQQGLCGICGETLPNDWVNIHVGHIVPRVVGGGDQLMNLQAAHASCNLEKGAKQLENYRGG